MGKPKFSLRDCIEEGRAEEDWCLLDNGGEHLYLAERAARFIQRPELAEAIAGSFRQFIDHENLYSIIPLPLIRKLHGVMVKLKEASLPVVNANYELLPTALHLLNTDDEELFDITEDKNGTKIYNFFNCLSSVEVLEDYFQQALELNKEIEYGKYT